MPTLRVTVIAELDDQPIFGSPIVKTIQTDVAQWLDFSQDPSSTVTLNDTQIATIAALILRSDQPVTLNLNGVTTAVKLNANGMLILLDCDILGDKTAANNQVVNNGGDAAEVKGVALGR